MTKVELQALLVLIKEKLVVAFHSIVEFIKKLIAKIKKKLS